MAPTNKNVENVTDASSQTDSVISETENIISETENISTAGNERSAMYLEDVFYDEIVGVTLRRAPGTHFLISCCGRFVMNDKFPHITKIYHATDKVRETYRYLNIERIKMHKLVGAAWVFNPAPTVFTCLDHIDGDTMNNHASNLRFITLALNNQNRHDENLKLYRGPNFRKGGVYFQSYIMREGKEVVLTSHGSRKEATEHAKKVRMLKFLEEYNAHITHDGESAGPRHSHMFLWTDKPVEVPTNNTETVSRIRRTIARRSSHYTL